MMNTVPESPRIYRFKFDDSFIDSLNRFSKVHQYDSRSDFKEAWKEWLDEHNEIIDSESTRLTNLGYSGDIIDKMFKSARYYFRKKPAEKKEPKKRHAYISIQKELLDVMDDHILKNSHLKPADGFIDFCMNNVESLKTEVINLIQEGITESGQIKSKMKKTYKNRYFILITS
jgi:hypothetical protein